MLGCNGQPGCVQKAPYGIALHKYCKRVACLALGVSRGHIRRRVADVAAPGGLASGNRNPPAAKLGLSIGFFRIYGRFPESISSNLLADFREISMEIHFFFFFT